MSTKNQELANSVLLAATENSKLDPSMQRFLSEGGRAVLFGETREEYLSREMSVDRTERESGEALYAEIEHARGLAGPVLVAVDQEVGGIQRLAHLLPDAPLLADMLVMNDAELEIVFGMAAQAAKQLGVNMFLAPIVDTLSGPNPWLEGRTVSDQVGEVARLSRCFVRAGEAAGVMSVVKHFPGHAHVPLDPATHARAIVEGSLTSLSLGFPAFETCIKEGAGGMMLGPAPVPAIDASCAACCSAVIVDLLRAHFAFGGLIVSDGLEAAATAAGRPVAAVAVQALNAGVELLLVGCDERLPQLATDIVAAVDRGELDEVVLLQAASKVEQAVDQYSEPV